MTEVSSIWRIHFRASSTPDCYDRETDQNGGIGPESRYCYNLRVKSESTIIVAATYTYAFTRPQDDIVTARGNKNATDCRAADTFFHANGEQHDIRGLDGGQINSLVALAKDGIAPADFSEAIEALRKRDN